MARISSIFKNLRDFFAWKCPYWRICPYYQKKSRVCNDPTAENGYCGSYREYQRREEKISFDSTLKKF